MNIINLTPHEIKIRRSDGVYLIVKPEDTPARCTETRKFITYIEGIPVTRAEYGDAEGLPDWQKDTIYIVSALVLNAVTDRLDVFAPGTAIRDEAGRIIACDGLSAGRAYGEAPDAAE
jgi:hypothetical protein